MLKHLRTAIVPANITKAFYLSLRAEGSSHYGDTVIKFARFAAVMPSCVAGRNLTGILLPR
jgi:hypothetical protein